MKRIIVLSFSLLALSVSAWAQSPTTKKAPGALDGKIYIIEVYEDGKTKKLGGEDDQLKFMTNKLTSTNFKGDWGFPASLYEGTVIDSTSEKHIIVFNCETKPNERGEILIWSGTVTGKDVEGTIDMQSKKGKTVKTFNFTGALKEKKVIKKTTEN